MFENFKLGGNGKWPGGKKKKINFRGGIRNQVLKKICKRGHMFGRKEGKKGIQKR